MHDSNDAKQREITDEFDSRRLGLPATIQPGQNLKRSAFFRITPSARQLIVSYQVDGEFRDVIVDLAPLQGFHANHGMNLDPIPAPLAPLTPPSET